MNFDDLEKSVRDAQRQGAPDNALISIPVGELDQLLDAVAILVKDDNTELEARAREAEDNLREVEKINHVQRTELEELRELISGHTLVEHERLAELRIAENAICEVVEEMRAAGYGYDTDQGSYPPKWLEAVDRLRLILQQKAELEEEVEPLEDYRELAWSVATARERGEGAASHFFGLAQRLHDPKWRPAWDHNGDGEISDAAELADYTAEVDAGHAVTCALCGARHVVAEGESYALPHGAQRVVRAHCQSQYLAIADKRVIVDGLTALGAEVLESDSFDSRDWVLREVDRQAINSRAYNGTRHRADLEAAEDSGGIEVTITDANPDTDIDLSIFAHPQYAEAGTWLEARLTDDDLRVDAQDQWSDLELLLAELDQRIANTEQRLDRIEAHAGIRYTEGDLADLFTTTDEEE